MLQSRWVFAVCVLVWAGCKCGGDKLLAKNVCEGVKKVQAGHAEACTGNDCADHFACSTVKDKGVNCCVFEDRKCSTEADCCPGQICKANLNKCFDKFLECSSDADCGDKGDRACEVYSDSYGTTSRCRFKACTALGECPTGQSCFQNECMVDLPCGGSCEAGKGCVPSIDRCQDYSHPTGREAASCPMTCNVGFVATFNDNRNIWDSCNLAAAKCVCAELPSLRSEDLGRFSALAVNPGKEIYASTYDGQYGDLAVFRFDLSGKLLGLEYVDGVPAGEVKWGKSGARGGVVEAGDDVGRYTDIAVANDKVYVSYYDVTHGDLKLAIRDESGWTTQRVDGVDGDVGLYSSIAIDSEGLPGIAYWQRGAEAAFDVGQCPVPRPTGIKGAITALKFARASSSKPASDTDWSIKILGCESRPLAACSSCNGVCADPGNGPACYTAATSCTSCDANTETCVTVGSAAMCAKKYNPSNIADISAGFGLFPSLDFDGKDGNIAFMRRVSHTQSGGPDGDLWAVHIGAQGTVSAPVMLDSSGDTGFFPVLKVDPATKKVAIAYHDFSTRSLKYYSAPQIQTGVVPQVIDPGTGSAGSGESNWVGTNTALVFGAVPGQIWAFYQDATKGDLRLAKRGTGWEVQSPVVTDGAVGFFVDAVTADGKVFVSHARFHARMVQGEPHVDNSLRLEVVPAN